MVWAGEMRRWKGEKSGSGQLSTWAIATQPTVAHSGPQWPKRAPGSINVTHWPLSLSFRKCKKCHFIKTSFLMPCLPEMVSFSDEMCLIARYCIPAIFRRWSVFHGNQTCIFMTHNQGGGLVVPDCQIINSKTKKEKHLFAKSFCAHMTGIRPSSVWNEDDN